MEIRSSDVHQRRVGLIIELTLGFIIGLTFVRLFLCVTGDYVGLYAILGIATQVPLLFFEGRHVRMWVFCATLIVFGLIIYDYSAGKRLRQHMVWPAPPKLVQVL